MGSTEMSLGPDRLASGRAELAALSADSVTGELEDRAPLATEGLRRRGVTRVKIGAGTAAFAVGSILFYGPPGVGLGLLLAGAVFVTGVRDLLRARRTAERRLLLVTRAHSSPWAFWARRWSIDAEACDGSTHRLTVPRHLRDEVIPGSIGVGHVHAGWLSGFEVLAPAEFVPRLARASWLRLPSGNPAAIALASVLGVPFLIYAAQLKWPAERSPGLRGWAPFGGFAIVAAAAVWLCLTALRDVFHLACEPPSPRYAAGPEVRERLVAALIDRARSRLRTLVAAGGADSDAALPDVLRRGNGRVATLVVSSPHGVLERRREVLVVVLEDASGRRAAVRMAGAPSSVSFRWRAGAVGWARIADGRLVAFAPHEK